MPFRFLLTILAASTVLCCMTPAHGQLQAKPTAKLSIHLGAGSDLGSAVRSASIEELERHNALSNRLREKRGGLLIIGDDRAVEELIEAAQKKTRLHNERSSSSRTVSPAVPD